ncbi:ammonium transporter [Planctomicrobium sp. SH661]|uniref:ammonium transporter n=1 Tax=Planctomicrobium sp. SH661 TaxID=3448124 RepID=UPI003F5B0D10
MKRRIALTLATLFGVTLLVGAMSPSAWAQEESAPPAAATTAEPAAVVEESVTEVVETNAGSEAAAPAPADIPADGNALAYTINTLFMLICAALVIFMQAGFALVETGLNSAKNAVNIMFKNLIDFCIGVTFFWLFGFNMMYPGEAYEGKVLPRFPAESGHLFVARDNPVTQENLDYGFAASADFMFQVAFAATAATIVSGAVAGRLKFSAYLAYSAIICALVYPVSGFWKWGGGFLAADGFQDFAGSIVVHSVGGFAGLMGAIALGPRIGRFSKEGKSHPIPGHNIPMACLGVFILLVGWYGFNPGSMLKYTGYVSAEATAYIAMTTTIAAAAGAIASMILAWVMFGKPDLTMGMNGMLAGLVGITANCDRVSQPESFIIGAIAGVIVVFAIVALEKLKIDDPVGAFPVHGACGIWGGLSTGIFGDIPEGFAFGDSRMGFFLVQLKATVVIVSWAIVTMGILFYALKAMGMLRVTPEEEIEGLDIGEHGMHAYGVDSPPA